jgi:hypothetical protein
VYSGILCTVSALATWTIRRLNDIIEAESGVSRHKQLLSVEGGPPLRDEVLLVHVFLAAETVMLQLARRPCTSSYTGRGTGYILPTGNVQAFRPKRTTNLICTLTCSMASV